MELELLANQDAARLVAHRSVCLSTSILQTAILLLRIDDIVSGHKKKDKDGAAAGGAGAE